MGSPDNPHRGMYTDQDRHPVGFWAYATTVWDYINRVMPANRCGTLKPGEVYALTAYLLYMNGIIKESDVMDAQRVCQRCRWPIAVLPGFRPLKWSNR